MNTYSKNNIKILVVLSSLSTGGAETMYMNIYRRLDKTKYKIDFLTFGTNDDFYASEIIKNGSRIFKMSSIKKTGLNGFCHSIKKAICENGPYDVIHSHIDYLSGFVMKIAKKNNIKIRISHSHNTSAHTHWGAMPKIFLSYIQNLINKNSTIKLACSQGAAEYMFGKSEVKNTVIINNAIDLNRFSDKGQYNSTIPFLHTDKKIILHTGRFVAQKNHRQLIEIYKKYIAYHKNTILLLVGDGELKNDIIHLVNTYNMQDNVFFLGIRSDIPELLSVADVFILPSKFEGLPVTLIEAQAMNVPCVVSTNIKKEVDCEMNLIYYAPLDNEEIWVSLIENAINKREKKNNYDIMTSRGYNIENNIEKIKQLYMGH